jgi:hypothetical protein
MYFKILGIFEILQLVESAKSKKEKIEILQQNRSVALEMVIQGAFDARIKWLLPEGKVPYNPAPGAGIECALYRQINQFYLFVQNGLPGLNKSRREQLFVQLLESVHPKDAEILVYVKDKSLPFKTITPELFSEAFPHIKDFKPIKIKKGSLGKKHDETFLKSEIPPDLEPTMGEVPVPAVAATGDTGAGQEYTYDEDPTILAQGLVPEIKEATEGKT